MRVLFAMDFSEDAKAAAGLPATLRIPRASRVTLLHVEENTERVIARISGMGRIALSHAVEQAMGERRRRTLS
jgi:hypothetical protein